MMLKIKPKDQEKLLEYVHWLIHNELPPVHIAPGLSESFESVMRLEILVSGLERALLSRVKTMPRALRGDKGLVRELVYKAIASFRAKGLQAPSWEKFEQELEDVIKGYAKEPLVDYLVVIPFHISGDWVKRRRRFTVLGMKFNKTSWRTLKKPSGWNDFLEKARGYFYLAGYKGNLSWFYSLVPLSVNVQARNFKDAFYEVSRNFELLRASFNLVKDYGMVHYQSSSPRSLGISFPPPVYGLFRDGRFETLYFERERYEYRPRPYDEERVVFVENQMKRLVTVSDDMQQMLIDALLKYGQAMDTTDWREAFLSLWQILETLSLASTLGVKTTAIPGRIINLMGVKPPYKSLRQDLIASLAESRNLLAHQGKFSEHGLIEINMLKGIVEDAIIALFARARGFPTRQSLEDFYTNVTQPDSVIQNRRGVLDAILKSRL